jgi:hypothetical protein
MGFPGAGAAAALLALALAVGAVAAGDSLADLGGAATEIESAPGNTPLPLPVAISLSLSGFLLVCRL